MTELGALLEMAVTEGHRDGIWQVLADWLEEYGDSGRAELIRLHRRLVATCLEPDHPGRAGWQARLNALLAAGIEPCVPRRTVSQGGGGGMTFAFIPPGTFLMGSPLDEMSRDEDETQHRVTLTQGYWLGVHPVTQAQWRAVTGDSPSQNCGDDLPVENVSWLDCQAFCHELSARLGRPVRLPTEAEWEHACRAGTTTPFSIGNCVSLERVNFAGYYSDLRRSAGSRPMTTPVGRYPPNALGLADMHGNVSEWCQDLYGDYPSADVIDPSGPSGGAARVLRGGGWDEHPANARSAFRSRGSPGSSCGVTGCRVVLSPG